MAIWEDLVINMQGYMAHFMFINGVDSAKYAPLIYFIYFLMNWINHNFILKTEHRQQRNTKNKITKQELSHIRAHLMWGNIELTHTNKR